jgi:two-component system nitrogen regulation sensor histidine kinase GlnL
MNTSVTLDNVHKRLLDNLKTGVLLLDAELCLLYMNMQAEHLLDISDTKANQAFIGDVLIGAESDIAEIRSAMASNSSFTKRSVELTVRPGKTVLVDYTINPVSENGNIQAVLELTSLEHSHRISQEESLHTAHLTTRELVRGLAHEIKNPLGGIRGAAQLLSEEIDSEELQDYTNVIIEEADRLHKLVDRLVGSRKPLEIASINIHEVLERVRSLIEADAASENISIVSDYDPSIPNVDADSDRLIQATLNIARNALQWLDDSSGKKTGRIILRTRICRNATIGAQFHRLAVKLEVEDNGPGIPAHMLGTIFYPMISGRADGSGLGLPITHGIINQHHGMIECSSKPGQTVFSVLLPFDFVENDEAAASVAQGK